MRRLSSVKCRTSLAIYNRFRAISEDIWPRQILLSSIVSISSSVKSERVKERKNTLSLPESNRSISVVVSFESVDQILVCDNSNECYIEQYFICWINFMWCSCLLLTISRSFLSFELYTRAAERVYENWVQTEKGKIKGIRVYCMFYLVLLSLVSKSFDFWFFRLFTASYLYFLRSL